MQSIEDLEKELLYSKLIALWYVVNKRLSPLQSNFKNQLNYLFSLIQKQYNKEGRLKDSLKEMYVTKLINFYTSLLGDISSITLKRVEGEIGGIYADASALINSICKKYINMRTESLANSVIADVFKCINMCEAGVSSEEACKIAVNTVFNKSFKGGRSSVVATTEVYKFHNFLYLSLMSKLSYKYICKISENSGNYINSAFPKTLEDLSVIPPMFGGDTSILFVNNDENFLHN